MPALVLRALSHRLLLHFVHLWLRAARQSTTAKLEQTTSMHSSSVIHLLGIEVRRGGRGHAASPAARRRRTGGRGVSVHAVKRHKRVISLHFLGKSHYWIQHAFLWYRDVAKGVFFIQFP